MGIFKLADSITGLNIPDGGRAVAVVIAKRHGGFPDADKAVAARPMSPTFVFEPASLPIHGRFDDYGGFVPDDHSLAARLACEMTGQPDWKTFQDKGLDFAGDGLAIAKHPRWSKLPGGKSVAVPQVFGLAVFSEPTWRLLHDVSGASRRRDSDLTTMRRILRDAVDAFAEPQSEARSIRVYHALGVIAFQKQGTYAMASGEEVEVPPVGNGLGRGEGGDTVHEEFRQWIGDYSPVAGTRHRQEGVTQEIETFYEGLWELREAVRGMDYFAKTLAPSPSVSWSGNACFAIDLGLHTVREAADALLDDVRENGEGRSSERLQAAVDRIGRMHAQLQAELAKALDYDGSDEPEDDDDDAAAAPTP